MSISKRLKNIRQSLNLSQKNFAKSLFISTSYYTLLETGNRRAKDSFLDLVCKIYNVNKNWLLFGKGDVFTAEPPDMQLEELLGIFKHLNEHFKGYILEQVRFLEKIQKNEEKTMGK
ncbi:MAG: helix-turn-helix domain-containing protein [Treponema sp.]|jgi:transcriptional regulator with XRE-family HTH domain|nr:helix-turn-helix domain-containing protein [Treponema sp.]